MAFIRSYKHPYLKSNIIQAYSSQKMQIQCMTYLYLPCSNSSPMALMYGHVNEWHGIKIKKQEDKP